MKDMTVEDKIMNLNQLYQDFVTKVSLYGQWQMYRKEIDKGTKLGPVEQVIYLSLENQFQDTVKVKQVYECVMVGLSMICDKIAEIADKQSYA